MFIFKLIQIHIEQALLPQPCLLGMDIERHAWMLPSDFTLDLPMFYQGDQVNDLESNYAATCIYKAPFTHINCLTCIYKIYTTSYRLNLE